MTNVMQEFSEMSRNWSGTKLWEANLYWRGAAGSEPWSSKLQAEVLQTQPSGITSGWVEFVGLMSTGSLHVHLRVSTSGTGEKLSLVVLFLFLCFAGREWGRAYLPLLQYLPGILKHRQVIKETQNDTNCTNLRADSLKSGSVEGEKAYYFIYIVLEKWCGSFSEYVDECPVLLLLTTFI